MQFIVFILLINISSVLAEKNSQRLVTEQPGIAVSGKVSDKTGNPLPGTTVVVKGTTIGVITDANGSFSLSVPETARILVFSFIGYKTEEVPVEKGKVYNIALAEDVHGVEEVVIVGYGTQNKATITGAISQVESTALIQTPASNVSNALVGRISGLLTTQTSGAPGFDQTNLRIRGVGTFTGLDAPLIMVDGVEAQSFNNIDPNEIETVSILKDASATAVYGVRGANGVLLITTKRGIVGKPQVSFSAQYALSRIAESQDFLGSPEWAEGYNLASAYDSYVTGVFDKKYSDADIQKYRDQSDPLFYPDVNWVDLVLKKVTTQSQYNFNINGGSDKSRYFISAGFLTKGGLFNEDVFDSGYDESIGLKRFNFRSNFDFDITKRLKLKVNFSSQIENLKGNYNPTTVQGYGQVLANLFTAPPNVSPGVWDGKIVNLTTQAGQFYQNPLPGIYGGWPFKKHNYNYLTGVMRLDYQLDFLLKGLSAHGMISYQNYNRVIKTVSRTLVTYLAFPISGGGYGLGPQVDESAFAFGEETAYTRREDFEAGLDYNRKFGDHSVTGLLLYNQSKEYPGPSLSIPRGYQGLIGRVTYDYRKRYMAEFNFGYNGTENFAVGHRFGFFPAFSAGYVISDEPFFPKNNVITYVKLRGSYGEVGNDKIGGTRFLYNPTSYVYGGYNDYALGIPGLNIARYQGAGEGTLGNPNVTWERAKKLDAGIDLVIFKNLKATVDYFHEKRDNILATPGTIPMITGTTFPAFNFGKMENWGIDGEVSFNSSYKELNYWARLIFTITDNRVIYKDEAQRPYSYLQSTGLRNGQYFGLLENGYYNTWDEVIDAYRPVSSFSNNRIQPGDFRYKDINGDGIINYDDQIPTGYAPFPNNSFGLSFGGNYKGFDVSVLFQLSTNYSHQAIKTYQKGWLESNGSTHSFVLDDSWTYEKYLAGEHISMPRVGIVQTSAHNYQTNTKWIENSAYLRLKNMEVGYSLPKRLLTKWSRLESVRIYANGYNLLNFDKLLPGEDPEVPTWDPANNEPYPIIATYNFGLNVKF
jgi:TonB-linked SusC/RagA family outer membrane protein